MDSGFLCSPTTKLLLPRKLRRPSFLASQMRRDVGHLYPCLACSGGSHCVLHDHGTSVSGERFCSFLCKACAMRAETLPFGQPDGFVSSTNFMWVDRTEGDPKNGTLIALSRVAGVAASWAGDGGWSGNGGSGDNADSCAGVVNGFEGTMPAARQAQRFPARCAVCPNTHYN